MKSYERRRRIWEMSLASTEKLVLMAIEDFCDEKSECYPSIATLGQRTQLSLRTIQRAIAHMARKGFLRIGRRRNGLGGQTSNHYTILFTRSHPSSVQAIAASPVTEIASPPVAVAPPPCQAIAPLPVRVTPKPNQFKPNQKEPNHSDPEVGFSRESLNRARELGVEVDSQIEDAAQRYPERVEEAIACLQEAKSVACPNRFLISAIEKDWRSRASGKTTAPKGFTKWFEEAKRRGIAIASEMREQIYIYTATGQCLPFSVISANEWPDLQG